MATGTTTLVPIVDIGPYLEGTPEGKAQVAAEVARACETSGFLMITGHGVDPGLISGLTGVAGEFFALPDEEKAKYPAEEGRGGYRATGSSALGRSTGADAPPDIAEFYSHHRLYGRTGEPIIPPQPPGFAAAFETYHDTMEEVAAAMMRIFALALDLEESWFEDHSGGGWDTRLLVNHYPAQEVPPEPGQIRLGAHTDFGTVTVLWQDDAPGGLQVLDSEGQWHDVASVPGTFVVNIGDLLAMWTNDRWVSTTHRVVNPPRESAGSDRFSIPFFQGAHPHARIETIPTCVGPDSPARYEPVLAGEWMQMKLKRSYG